ncbi:MAG: hypothetical protein H7Y08_03155 [Rhizobiaceae bacterium]|nr:hypothetical protein [Rhizobiaceae bacterium]
MNGHENVRTSLRSRTACFDARWTAGGKDREKYDGGLAKLLRRFISHGRMPQPVRGKRVLASSRGALFENGERRMTTATMARDKDLLKVAAWMAMMPILVAWPILSTIAFLSLFVEGQSPVVYAVQALLFVSGFWTFLAGYLFVQSVKRSEDSASAAPAASIAGRGLVVGSYVLVWTFFYVIAAFASS